jgi:acyl transferase domain-containing protein
LVSYAIELALRKVIEFTCSSQGCRLPGGVSNPSQFWDLLCEKRTGYQEFEPERINLDGYYHPNANRPASLPTRGANLLREDPRLFDHRFFGLKDIEVRSMDPNQRKMLEVTYEAFESAAEPLENLSGSRTGVFIGNFNTDHHLNQMYDIDFALPYTATGGSTSILSNRVNHVFNLRGPRLVCLFFKHCSGELLTGVQCYH